MAANPVKRARSSGDRIATAPFPIATKPDDWQLLSIARRIEHNLGLSVDRAHDYLSWPPDKCDAHQLAAQKEVVRAHLYAGFRFIFDRAKDEERARALEDIARQMQPGIEARADARADAAATAVKKSPLFVGSDRDASEPGTAGSCTQAPADSDNPDEGDFRNFTSNEATKRK